MYKFSILLILLLTHWVSYGQEERKYPSNYVDIYGLEQGDWLIYDSDSLLLLKIKYKNGTVLSTQYYDLDGNAIEIVEADSVPRVINEDLENDPFIKNHKIQIAVVLKCKLHATILVNEVGDVEEVRFIKGCSNKINKKFRKYLESRKYEPAANNGEPIIGIDYYARVSYRTE